MTAKSFNAADGTRPRAGRWVGSLGAATWAQWDELRHTLAVIGTVLMIGMQPRQWVRAARRALAPAQICESHPSATALPHTEIQVPEQPRLSGVRGRRNSMGG